MPSVAAVRDSTPFAVSSELGLGSVVVAYAVATPISVVAAASKYSESRTPGSTANTWMWHQTGLPRNEPKVSGT